MGSEKQNPKPVSLKNFEVEDDFWTNEMELVRKEVLPYQWDMLNDRVEGAEPSFCMRNFKIAAKVLSKGHAAGYSDKKQTRTGIVTLPEDMEHLEDKFYGFVFQDSDFSKWIEAVGYTLMRQPDPELEKLADEAIDIVCKAQHESGYLDTYYIIGGMEDAFTSLRNRHELYCFGHLTEGAVSYYEATGKDKLLKAAIRFADYIADYFGPDEGKCKGYPGHEEAELALVRLYEVTNDRKYLELAKFFLDERGKQPYYFDIEQGKAATGKEEYQYFQAHRPVREQNEAVGHAVRAVYLYSGMADVARITGDEGLADACRRLWKSVVNEKMYITGAIGATAIGEAFSFPYDLPNDTAYAETCAAIGLVFWARRMLQLEMDSQYADIMEVALYNAVLSGMALDGKSFFYVNPLEVHPEACHSDERLAHVKPVRQKWFGCACCPPNLARMVSSVPAYAYFETESQIFIHLYIGGRIRKKVKNQEVMVRITSEFPWSGKVTVEMEKADHVNMGIALRLPGWCRNYEIKKDLNKQYKCEKGYLYIEGNWEKGDRIEIEFPMQPRFYSANDLVRENAGKVALMKGPIVYCMEEADNQKGLHLLQVLPGEKIKNEECVIAGEKFPMLLVKGRKKVNVSETALYYEYEQPVYKDVTLKFIPYFSWANRGENEMMVWVNKSES